MACRTWTIRGLILAGLAGLAGGVWWAHSYVSPESVRAALIATLGDQLAGADVHVGSARMRVFGGISVTDLRITRRGETEPFFAAPAAVIYHDKEEINRGRLTIRKVELDGPRLRLECGPDGTWNVAGLARPSAPDKPVPTFVATRATVTLADRRPGGLPPVTLTDAKLSLLNDPLPVIRAEGHATVTVPRPDGPGLSVRAAVSVRVNRVSGQVQAGIELPELALGPDLAGLVEAVKPGAGDLLGRLTGRAGVRADLAYHPGAAAPFRYDVRLAVADGRLADAGLPWPVEKIEAVVRARDGRVTVEKATATAGRAAVEVRLETRAGSSPPAAAGGLPGLEDQLEHATVTVRDLAVDDTLFDRLPPGADAHRLRRMFGPAGTVHVGYRLARSPAGGWTRDLELRPARLRLVYEKFRYPLDDVTGVVRRTATHAGADETHVDLTGSAAGQRIEVKGSVAGAGPDPAIHLKVSGTNVPIDDRLFDALPKEKYRTALKKLRAAGRADFVADIRQRAGVNLTENTFRIAVYDAALNCTHFPYPLDQVRGKLFISVPTVDPTRPVDPARPGAPPPPDRVELRDFEARHGPGVVTLAGENEPIPGTPDRRLTLRVWGKGCPVDARLRAALAAIRLDGVWRTFNPRGAITFGVEVEITDRAAAPPAAGPVAAADPVARLVARARPESVPNDPPFNPATDLKLALNFEGPSVTPDFFPVPLDRLSGRVRFEGRQVRVEQFAAERGASKWTLNAGEVRFYDTGRVWANLGRLEVAPLVADEVFRDALPPKLKAAAGELALRGPATLTVHHLVVLTPPDAPPARPPSEPLPLPRLLPLARGQSPESFDRGPTVREGAAEALPDGRASAITPDPEVYWNAELRLAGAALAAGLDWDEVRGVVACAGRYHGTHLGDVAGTVWLDGAAVARHPVSNVKAAFAVRPQEPDPARPGEYLPPAVQFADLSGTLFRGAVGGEARVVLADPPRYRVWLTAADVNLADVARHHNLGNGAKLEGTAQARLDLQTAPDPATGRPVLRGGGAVDVTGGQLLNLPVLMPLLKTLKLQAPDKTAFEEGHATFTVRGDRVTVDHLDLLGTAVSLGGSGELDTAGEHVKFEFYTIWSQTLQRWLTTPFGDVSAFVSEKLFKIEVTRGPDGQMKYEPRVVPFVTAPFRAVADRVKRRRGPTTYRAAPGK